MEGGGGGTATRKLNCPSSVLSFSQSFESIGRRLCHTGGMDDSR